MVWGLVIRSSGYRFSDFVRDTNVHNELTTVIDAVCIKRAMVYHGINEPETFELVGMALKRI